MSFLLRAVTFGDTICCRRTKVNRKLSCHPQPADDSVLCLESRRVMSGSAQFLCRAAGVARSLSSSAWAPQLSSRPSRSHARRLAQSSEVCPAKLRPYVRPSVRDDRQASSRLPVALRPLFKLGERQQLACFVDDCPVTPVISWTPLDDRPLNARVRTRDNLSLLTFEPVDMEHEGPLLCKVTCGEQHKQAKTHIRLYAFPSDPEIRGHDPVRAGEESTLTCQLRDLYPAESLTLDWLRGGQVVRSVPGEAGATSVQSAYTFTPQRAESGENLTCRATLDLHDLPPPERTRQTVTRLHVTSRFPTVAPVVTVLSDPGTVSSGSVLILSCSASGNPAPVLMWTFRPEDGGPLEVKGHSETLVLAAQAGEFRCEARNHEGKDSKAVRVRINASPSNTSMLVSPGRELMEGQRVTFTCRSHGAPPPVLVLSREGEELWRSDSTPWLTFSLSVRPDDAGQYRCDASNPLGTQRVTQNVTVAGPVHVCRSSSQEHDGGGYAIGGSVGGPERYSILPKRRLSPAGCCPRESSRRDAAPLRRRRLPIAQCDGARFGPLPGQRQQPLGPPSPSVPPQRDRARCSDSARSRRHPGACCRCTGPGPPQKVQKERVLPADVLHPCA
ncbi:vascular cell adhesion protein 1b isoform X2 [Syngnathus scovelli]|uniref:vascular cell adhesion protein 1b isoform X2 n=1 Tax=Syngnathus scovelli TaxID=161590 RepID=UPI00210FE23E|nr:vascular cell adhesion protein 1b isoform X2 [Syngnathus scovelli]